MKNTSFGQMFAEQMLFCYSFLLTAPFSARTKALPKKYFSGCFPNLYLVPQIAPLFSHTSYKSVVPIDTSQVVHSSYGHFLFTLYVKPDDDLKTDVLY